MLTTLTIDKLRNLSNTQLDLSSQFNIFYGDNGAGKTSILEALHFLLLGKSFRTHLTKHIIHYDQDSFSLFGIITNDQQEHKIGVQRHKNGAHRIKLNGTDTTSHTEIAKLAPIQIFQPDGFKLLNSGPQFRREFLDWGLFHVEQGYLKLWQTLNRTIKQRNSALRHKLPFNQIQAWDQPLIDTSLAMHQLRLNYIDELKPVLLTTLERLGMPVNIDINYYPGWNANLNYPQALQSQLQRDLELGYTQSGPHRANIEIKTNHKPVQHILSQGQQKVLLSALKMTQGIHLYDKTNKPCIYLLDDLAAQLDTKNQLNIATMLSDTGSQALITAVEKPFSNEFYTNAAHSHQLFHVEHGKIKQEK